MKRTLVSYESSDDDEHSIQHPEHVKKRSVPLPRILIYPHTHTRRKLPTLPTSLTPAVPVDNSRLHQGRTRTTPHVEGQFSAHVYVALVVGRETALGRLVEEVVGCAKGKVSGLWGIGGDDGNGESGELELHVSLSRPTYLRAHQREEFKRAVKNVARSFNPCVCLILPSLFTHRWTDLWHPLLHLQSSQTMNRLGHSSLWRSVLGTSRCALTLCHNTHTFPSLSQLAALAQALTPALHAIRQKEFYADPRFHSSIAWALHPVPPLTALLPTLNAKFSTRLAHVGSFDVGEVIVKIGKDLVGWGLGGR
jgi:hypothetical protein